MSRLPNLIIAGVPKAGTTSLFWYLNQHPDICASLVKEVSYFTPLRNPDMVLPPIGQYEKHFTHCGGTPYVMEASPSYCYGGQPVIDAIRRTLDQPRILISLRDPVRRFWSTYTFQHSRGRLTREARSCDDFITLCQRQRADGTDRELGNRRIALSVGFYAEYLSLWLDAFGDDCKVIFAEQLFEDTLGTVTDICGWLGIDTSVVSSFDYAPRNTTAHARIPALGRAAYTTREVTDKLLRRYPGLRHMLRKVYFGLNTTEMTERLEPATRERLKQIYAESNAQVAGQLRARGHEHLPDWLTNVEAAG